MMQKSISDLVKKDQIKRQGLRRGDSAVGGHKVEYQQFDYIHHNEHENEVAFVLQAKSKAV